jgi:hypothetical protein
MRTIGDIQSSKSSRRSSGNTGPILSRDLTVLEILSRDLTVLEILSRDLSVPEFGPAAPHSAIAYHGAGGGVADRRLIVGIDARAQPLLVVLGVDLDPDWPPAHGHVDGVARVGDFVEGLV